MKCWIVAEAGVNWDGDRTKIVALIEAAKKAGASHVKFQAFNTDVLVARRKITDQKTIALLRRNELTDDDLDMIQREAKRVGIPHFYSVFDPSQVERVLSRGACALKIGHAEARWTELEKECRAWHGCAVPLWISYTSQDAHILRDAVWCVGEYPAKSSPCLNLVGAWDNDDCESEIGGGFKGFSSHYTDYRIPAAAALRGAEYVECHLRLSDTDPEAAWSLSPEDFGKMVKLIREFESWL